MLVRTAALSLVVAATALAAPRDDARALREAKAHFRKGAIHYHAREYEQAIAEYQAAYQLSPLPDLLFNLAQAYRLIW